MFHIAVDKTGATFVEKKPISLPDLYTALTNRFAHNPQLPVFIGGDADTQHGDMVKVLETVRRAGVQRISFTVTQGEPGRP
jgi:biopolymer transport protein ExbD